MDRASCSRDASSGMNPSETNSNNGGESAAATEGEGEDDDSSSSSSFSSLSPSSSSTVVHLDNFRQQWQRELENPSSHVPATNKRNTNCDNEESAKDLYLKGVEAERRGQLYDAIRYYRRAVQLVPDIEFRIADFIPKGTMVNVDDGGLDFDGYESDRDDGDESSCCDVDDDVEDLSTRFARFCSWDGKICRPLYDQTASHVSILPSEILIYIFKWVVSSELDMRSLEQLSMVSRGFYLCARDMELWRLACMKIWGVNCGSPNMYGSWRDMFILRPHLRFSGAYISKTTYIRPGEPAFQDLTYRPWHVVDYYRYMRFFPEGLVLMMTTPDEPVLSLSKLRHRNVRHQAVLSGHYRIRGNMVTAIMKRTKVTEVIQSSTNRYRRGRQIQYHDQGEQTFHVELEITAYKARRNYKLEWRHYSTHTVYRNGQESVSEFELSHTKFPSLWFSGVRSYTSYSDKPLL